MFGIKFNKKIAVALGIGVLAMSLFAGCGSSSQETNEKGVLRVGSETTFPPFEYTDDQNNAIGFDVDLSQEIAKRLGLKMEFVSMGFDALIPAVNSGSIDMIAAGMNPTPEREKAVDFSDIYFNEGGFTAVVRKDNTDIKGIDDLKGKVVGAQVGSVPADMAKALPASQVKEIDSNSQIFMELKAGTIDGAIMDNAVAMFYLKQGADKDLKLVGNPTESTGIALGFKKGNTKLRDDVNKALKEMKEDGTYQKIYEKWFGAYKESK